MTQPADAVGYDPEIDIDWDALPVEGLSSLSDHAVSLYGTRRWERLSPEQRRELARSEAAEILGLTLLGKAFISHLLLRSASEDDQESERLRRTLTELADNARHLVMFARAMDAVEATDRALRPAWLRRLVPFGELLPVRPFSWAAIYAVNELLLAHQLELASDNSVQPALRMVARVHVADQTRHAAHARDELLRTAGTIGGLERLVTRSALGAGAIGFRYLRIRPTAYAAAGLNPIVGWVAAQRNEHYLAMLARNAERLVTTFQEAGLIEGPLVRAAWKHAGLLQGRA
ncbi:MAG TPA: diiron oxygenase [Nocardioidaceae bacterium]|nr:diiron oxygenase [Nocardioidaceae bacterium]